LKEASPTKVISCVLVTSTDLQKDLDASNEATGGVNVPSAKMAGQPWFVSNRPPVMRADHHQHAEVPPIPEVVECARLMLFPPVR
jgi:hypothetical protein